MALIQRLHFVCQQLIDLLAWRSRQVACRETRTAMLYDVRKGLLV